MDFKLTVSDKHIKNIEKGYEKAVEMMDEVENYKKLNFFERMFTEKVYVDINLEYAEKFLIMSQDQIALILGFEDIYYLPKEQKDELCNLLDKIMQQRNILVCFDLYLERKLNKKPRRKLL